ncbi:SRPBCC family protein [Roseobacter sp. HKCCD9010]|uniref:SRPBCC family protein n=1 Tax=unclassified Roseobacter TaxID=196798 RepID=UPI00149219A4|nr:MULTISPECIES: SRPBCC family protein [unclassified Roseobacter]MBF9048750.1 SRPBCC family protein [Rhodobacterales bacterium HKCCD4356]NNV10749.1 SRPBCC family protein [Roseobacter sp. HKCCD7357]NNV14934.1 SRPBCC family protein [Roseobacter sp. HKCCD8768]NNV24393.1 SRPBCC family protein [Roseobacter sp. HKCCD8192]NNV28650.1 SRPBCC family protein [Roseobacter sp. HKCCD9061]
MKFKVAEDVDAPIGFVFERMTDFSQFEADVKRRGADLRRVGNWTQIAEGVQWRGAVQVRGKKRKIEAELTELVPDESAKVDITVGGMEAVYQMAFIALSPEVTRVATELDLKPRTLTARLIIQTLKLARGRVVRRMTRNLMRQGNQTAAAWRQAARG